MSAKARQANIHEVPDPRTRERVSFQPLPDASAQDRDCACALPHRKTDQNLVPEPTHEAKEGTPSRERDKRAGSQRTRGTRQNEAATAGEAGEARGAAPRAPRDPPPRPDEDAHRQRFQRPSQSEQSPRVRSPHLTGDHD